jgi:hypothetical protein
MMNRIRAVLNVLLITSIFGLAISYISQLLTIMPDLNFLEAVGLYCLSIPVTQLLKSAIENEDE